MLETVCPLPILPALRLGVPYESLDTHAVSDSRSGRRLLTVSSVNAGVIRRDLPKYAAARKALQKIPIQQLLKMCARAGDIFMSESLPLWGPIENLDSTNSKCATGGLSTSAVSSQHTDGQGGRSAAKTSGTLILQSPEDYIRDLSSSSGLPHGLVRRNMKKIQFVFQNMETILKGLTRGLDLKILDDSAGEEDELQQKSRLSFYALSDVLGVVLPSNSPGVNSLWMPAIALKIPVILKPGREEPWTPWRIIQAFIAAGIPREVFGFYPAEHDGAAEILSGCQRTLLFGDQSTTDRWATNPKVQIHGPGYSKILIGNDRIENWRDEIDVMISSILDNGGRSCVNASTVIVPKYGREIALELAARLGSIAPRSADDEAAQLSAFANPQMADWIDANINEGLSTVGAEDLTAKFRSGPRKVVFEGGTYLRPTVIFCDTILHPLARREFLFPYVSVIEISQEKMLAQLGPSLVVSALTDAVEFSQELLASPLIARLNLGSIPTTEVAWDQPHEGNLFEFLYRQRAILRRPTHKTDARI